MIWGTQKLYLEFSTLFSYWMNSLRVNHAYMHNLHSEYFCSQTYICTHFFKSLKSICIRMSICSISVMFAVFFIKKKKKTNTGMQQLITFDGETLPSSEAYKGCWNWLFSNYSQNGCVYIYILKMLRIHFSFFFF